MTELNNEAIELIEQLGGNAKAAELCEVSRAAVSQWRHNGIPKAQLKFIKAVRVDLFPVGVGQGTAGPVVAS